MPRTCFGWIHYSGLCTSLGSWATRNIDQEVERERGFCLFKYRTLQEECAPGTRDLLDQWPVSSQDYSAAAAAKSCQSCLTLWDPIDGTPPGSSVPGILQARILDCVASSFSNALRHAKLLQSCPTLYDPMDSSPSRPPCPRDSLGKNIGVSCHFLLHSELPSTFVETRARTCQPSWDL